MAADDDCFSGFKSDLLTESDALDLMAEMDVFLKKNLKGWQGIHSFGQFNSDVWAQQRDYIEKIKWIVAHADAAGISNSAKLTIARYGTRMSAVDRLVSMPWEADSPIQYWLDNLDFLLELQGKSTFFKKDWPTDQLSLEGYIRSRMILRLKDPKNWDLENVDSLDLLEKVTKLHKIRDYEKGITPELWDEAIGVFLKKQTDFKTDAGKVKMLEVFPDLLPVLGLGDLDTKVEPKITNAIKQGFVSTMSLLDEGEFTHAEIRQMLLNKGYAKVNIAAVGDTIDEFTEAVGELGKLGLKFNPDIADYDLDEVTADLKKYLELDTLFDATEIEAIEAKWLVKTDAKPLPAKNGKWYDEIEQIMLDAGWNQGTSTSDAVHGYKALVESGYDFEQKPHHHLLSQLASDFATDWEAPGSPLGSWQTSPLTKKIITAAPPDAKPSTLLGKYWDVIPKLPGEGVTVAGKNMDYQDAYKALLDLGYDWEKEPVSADWQSLKYAYTGKGLHANDVKSWAEANSYWVAKIAAPDADVLPDGTGVLKGKWYSKLNAMAADLDLLDEDSKIIQDAYDALVAGGLDYIDAPTDQDMWTLFDSWTSNVLGPDASGKAFFLQGYKAQTNLVGPAKGAGPAPALPQWWSIINSSGLPGDVEYQPEPGAWKFIYNKMNQAGYDLEKWDPATLNKYYWAWDPDGFDSDPNLIKLLGATDSGLTYELEFKLKTNADQAKEMLQALDSGAWPGLSQEALDKVLHESTGAWLTTVDLDQPYPEFLSLFTEDMEVNWKTAVEEYLDWKTEFLSLFTEDMSTGITPDIPVQGGKWAAEFGDVNAAWVQDLTAPFKKSWYADQGEQMYQAVTLHGYDFKELPPTWDLQGMIYEFAGQGAELQGLSFDTWLKTYSHHFKKVAASADIPVQGGKYKHLFNPFGKTPDWITDNAVVGQSSQSLLEAGDKFYQAVVDGGYELDFENLSDTYHLFNAVEEVQFLSDSELVKLVKMYAKEGLWVVDAAEVATDATTGPGKFQALFDKGSYVKSFIKDPDLQITYVKYGQHAYDELLTAGYDFKVKPNLVTQWDMADAYENVLSGTSGYGDTHQGWIDWLVSTNKVEPKITVPVDVTKGQWWDWFDDNGYGNATALKSGYSALLKEGYDFSSDPTVVLHKLSKQKLGADEIIAQYQQLLKPAKNKPLPVVGKHWTYLASEFSGDVEWPELKSTYRKLISAGYDMPPNFTKDDLLDFFWDWPGDSKLPDKMAAHILTKAEPQGSGEFWSKLAQVAIANDDLDYDDMAHWYAKWLNQGFEFDAFPESTEIWSSLTGYPEGESKFWASFVHSVVPEKPDTDDLPGKWWGVFYGNFDPDHSTYDVYKTMYTGLLEDGYDLTEPKWSKLDLYWDASENADGMNTWLADQLQWGDYADVQLLPPDGAAPGKHWDHVYGLGSKEHLAGYQKMLNQGVDFKGDPDLPLLKKFAGADDDDLPIWLKPIVSQLEGDTDPIEAFVMPVEYAGPSTATGQYWDSFNFHYGADSENADLYLELLDKGLDWKEKPTQTAWSALETYGVNGTIAKYPTDLVTVTAGPGVPGQHWAALDHLLESFPDADSTKVKRLYQIALHEGYDFAGTPNTEMLIEFVSPKTTLLSKKYQKILKTVELIPGDPDVLAKLDALYGDQPYLSKAYQLLLQDGYQVENLKPMHQTLMGELPQTGFSSSDWFGDYTQAQLSAGDWIDHDADLFSKWKQVLEDNGLIIKTSDAKMADKLDGAAKAMLSDQPLKATIGEPISLSGAPTIGELIAKGVDPPDAPAVQLQKIKADLFDKTIQAQAQEMLDAKEMGFDVAAKWSSMPNAQHVSEEYVQSKLTEIWDQPFTGSTLDHDGTPGTGTWTDILVDYAQWKQSMLPEIPADVPVFVRPELDLASIIDVDIAQEMLEALDSGGWKYTSNALPPSWGLEPQEQVEGTINFWNNMASKPAGVPGKPLSEFMDDSHFKADVEAYLKWKKSKFGAPVVEEAFEMDFKSLTLPEQATEMLDALSSGDWEPDLSHLITNQSFDDQTEWIQFVKDYPSDTDTPMPYQKYLQNVQSGELSDYWKQAVEEYIEFKKPQLKPADPALQAQAFKQLKIKQQADKIQAAIDAGMPEPEFFTADLSVFKAQMGESYVEGQYPAWTKNVDEYLKWKYGETNPKVESGSWSTNAFLDLTPTEQFQMMTGDPQVQSAFGSVLSKTMAEETAGAGPGKIGKAYFAQQKGDAAEWDEIVKKFAAFKSNSAQPTLVSHLPDSQAMAIMQVDPDLKEFLQATQPDWGGMWYAQIKEGTSENSNPWFNKLKQAYDEWHAGPSGAGALDGSIKTKSAPGHWWDTVNDFFDTPTAKEKAAAAYQQLLDMGYDFEFNPKSSSQVAYLINNPPDEYTIAAFNKKFDVDKDWTENTNIISKMVDVDLVDTDAPTPFVWGKSDDVPIIPGDLIAQYPDAHPDEMLPAAQHLAEVFNSSHPDTPVGQVMELAEFEPFAWEWTQAFTQGDLGEVYQIEQTVYQLSKVEDTLSSWELLTPKQQAKTALQALQNKSWVPSDAVMEIVESDSFPYVDLKAWLKSINVDFITAAENNQPVDSPAGILMKDVWDQINPGNPESSFNWGIDLPVTVDLAPHPGAGLKTFEALKELDDPVKSAWKSSMWPSQPLPVEFEAGDATNNPYVKALFGADYVPESPSEASAAQVAASWHHSGQVAYLNQVMAVSWEDETGPWAPVWNALQAKWADDVPDLDEVKLVLKPAPKPLDFQGSLMPDMPSYSTYSGLSVLEAAQQVSHDFRETYPEFTQLGEVFDMLEGEKFGPDTTATIVEWLKAWQKGDIGQAQIYEWQMLKALGDNTWKEHHPATKALMAPFKSQILSDGMVTQAAWKSPILPTNRLSLAIAKTWEEVEDQYIVALFGGTPKQLHPEGVSPTAWKQTLSNIARDHYYQSDSQLAFLHQQWHGIAASGADADAFDQALLRLSEVWGDADNMMWGDTLPDVKYIPAADGVPEAPEVTAEFLRRRGYDAIDEVLEAPFGELPPLKIAEVQLEDIVHEGTHPKTLMQGPDGETYLFKPSPVYMGEVQDFRVEVEHTAHQVAELFDFDMAPSWIVEGDGGKFGQVQQIVAGSNLKGVKPGELTERARRQLAVEHVFDWMLDNDDSHAGNFIVRGNRVYSIDKGRAWKHLGRNELRLGRLNTNAQTYYSMLYDDIIRKADQGELDSMYRAVKEKIFRVRDIYDRRGPEYRDLLRTGLANRPYSGSMTHDRYIEIILDRLEDLDSDFDALWTQIYSRAGLERPDIEISSMRPPGWGRVEGIHRGWSDDFIEDVRQVGGHGISTFYRNDQIEKSIEFSWMEREGDRDVFRSEIKLLPGEFERQFTDRLDDMVGGAGAKPMRWKRPKSGVWDSEEQFFHKLQEAAKTISYHAETEIGQYNQARIDGLLDAERSLNIMLREFSTPTTDDDWMGEYTRESLLEVLQGYRDDIDMLKVSMDSQTKPQYHVLRRAGERRPGLAPVTKWDYEVTKVDEILNYVHPAINQMLYDPDTGLADITDAVAHRGSTKTRTAFNTEHYIIKVSDNIQVNYTPDRSSLVTVKGRLRVTVKDFTDAQDLEAYREFLSDVLELDMTPADDDHIELTYWRMYLNASKSYSDSTHWSPAYEYWKEQMRRRPLLPAREEIDIIKEGLRRIGQTDAQLDPADGKWWMPKFKHGNLSKLDLETGRPMFRRHDLMPDEVLDALGGLPSYEVTGGGRMPNIVKTGGSLGTSERQRMLRMTNPSMSPDTDMAGGGRNGVFLRTFRSDHDIFYNPDLARQLDSYWFDEDKFGRVADRSSYAEFDIVHNLRTAHRGMDELLVRDFASLMEDIEVVKFNDRQELDDTLDWLRARGIREIRGLPIEDRLVYRSEVYDAVKKAEQMYRDRIAKEGWW